MRRLLCSLCAAVFFLSASPQVARAEPHRALFIGNSYTAANHPQDLKGQYQALMQEAVERGLWSADAVEVSDVTAGGYLLRMHLEDAKQSGSELAQQLAQKLSVVVLQEQSQIPGLGQIGHPEYTKSKSAFVALDDMVDSAGAETVALMTWGRRDGDSQSAHMNSFKKMQAALAKGYEGFLTAASTPARPVRMAPAGLAFEAIYDQLLKDGVQPTDEGTLFHRLYDGDGSHQTVHGSYVAALCVVGAVTGLNVTTLTWRPDGVSADDATRLRAAALSALSIWPPPAPPSVVEPDEPDTSTDVSSGEEVVEEVGSGSDAAEPDTAPADTASPGAVAPPTPPASDSGCGVAAGRSPGSIPAFLMLAVWFIVTLRRERA